MYEEKEAELTYSDIDPQYRIKVFEFDRDQKAIDLITDRVEACRRYIEELTEFVKIENTQLI